MRGLAFGAVVCGLVACSPSSPSAYDPSTAGAQLSAACSGCHMPGGTVMGDLSELTEGQLAAALTAYKTDTSGTSVMHRLAQGYTSEEIARISAYLSRQDDKL